MMPNHFRATISSKQKAKKHLKQCCGVSDLALTYMPPPLNLHIDQLFGSVAISIMQAPNVKPPPNAHKPMRSPFLWLAKISFRQMGMLEEDVLPKCRILE